MGVQRCRWQVTVFTAWLLIGESHDLEASAYKFAVVIIGALATKAVQAASVKAFPTMMLMAMCAMFLAAIIGVHRRRTLQG